MANTNKLANAFPSSPSRPPLLNMQFFTERGDLGRRSLGTHSFGAIFSARHFLDAATKQPYTWLSENSLIDANGTEVVSKDGKLEEVVEHKFTSDEKKWELPEPYTSYARMIRTGVKKKTTPPESATLNPDTGEPFGRDPKADAKFAKKRGLTDDDKKKKNKRTAPPRKELPQGYTSLATICEGIKMEPREARQLLRKSNTPKPEHGWAWPSKDAAKIQAMLKKGQKK